MRKNLLTVFGLLAVLVLTSSSVHAGIISFDSRTLVSTNNANFDISVFEGNAKYNDRGVGGSQPGSPSFETILGDGTVLDYNFVGNANNGSTPLTTYASGGAGRIPTPTSPIANTHGSGEDWANVWTTNDPGPNITFDGSAKNHNPTGVTDAGNTFARTAEVDGTIDISGLESGQVYIPHGSYLNQWNVTLTMTGDGQTDLVAADGKHPISGATMVGSRPSASTTPADCTTRSITITITPTATDHELASWAWFWTASQLPSPNPRPSP